MIKNYFIVTLRNLFKNRVYALINILGLGLALAICIVAYFNHMFAYEFDRSHENFDEIYRINSYRDMQGRDQEYGLVPATLGLEIQKDIPGIKKVARLMRSGSPVKADLEIFNMNISYVDPEFLDIFTFNLLSGNKSSIENKGNVFISKELSEILFGKDDPVGKSISIFNDQNNEHAYLVAGVFDDLPQNSSFRIDVLTHFDNFLKMWETSDTDWKTWARVLFVQFDDPSIIENIENGLDKYIPIQNKAREDFIITGFRLVPLKDVGDNSREIWSGNLYPGMHPAAVVSPPVMAILILLIACFNFANTSIAAAGRRLKEIGLRKVVGGQKGQLVVQFLLENMLITLLALFVAIGIAKFLVPAYSSMWEYMTIQLSFTEYMNFWIFLLLLLLFTGFLAGAYPAFYISSLNPVVIFRGKSSLGSAGTLSKVLLVFQFTISVTSLASGFIFAKNASYQETLDLGYDRDMLIVVPAGPDIFNRYLDAVLTNPKVISAAGTQEHIGWGNYRRPLEDENQQIEVDVLDIGPEYAQTMGLRLIDGRLFEKARVEADRSGSIIVNQNFVEAFGWENPVGHVVTLYDTTRLTVIGVVADYYVAGMWREIEPAIMRLAQTDSYYTIAVRANAEDLADVLKFCEDKWIELAPNYPFLGRFQEDTLEEAKLINKSIKQLFIFLAIAAMVLSLIGLYTLTSLNIISKTKEIGVRKILGAPITSIIGLLSKKFLILLTISSIIGSIGAYFLSDMLLDSIWDHFLDMTPDIFIWSIIIMLIVAAVTISGMVYKAAMQNPATSLRYE